MNSPWFRHTGWLAAASLAAACSSGNVNPPSYEADVTYRTALVQYDSCAALEADLKSTLIAEVETQFEQIRDNRFGFPEEDVAAPGGDGSSGGREEGTDYSGTNNQEDGVDEADFVKTDGYHIYVLNGNRLHIFGVPEFGALEDESSTEIEGYPSQLLVNSEAGKAVVFSAIHPDQLPAEHPLRDAIGFEEDERWMWRVGSLSKVTVLDISDRTQPTLERELFLEGNYQTARMVDGSVRLGAYSWMNVPGAYDWYWDYDGSDESFDRARSRARQRIAQASLAEIIPQIYERLPDGSLSSHSLSQDACRSFYRPENSNARGFSSIISLDLAREGFHFDADHVLSNWPTLYSSGEYMYIAESANDWWWFWWNEDHPEQLNLHMFDIRTPGESIYLGSGRVEGTLINQFAMDEHEGYLRVATTTNRWARWWLEDPAVPENHIFVLGLQGRELVEVGHLGGIAENESIFAARMIGDRGYLVTFEQIDPLFTLDLSDPTNPRVVGELELPGFSTYIHPIADDMLLTIGVGGDETGANWRTQISMFDVSDFAQPQVFSQEALVSEDEWGWSEALYEHKAFQYWAPKKLLAIPLSSYSEDGPERWTYLSKLELVTVDPDSGLARYGTIDHSGFYNSDPEHYWWYRDIRRSIFMGDFVYAISDRGITAHHLDELATPVAEQALPGYSNDDIYWWW